MDETIDCPKCGGVVYYEHAFGVVKCEETGLDIIVCVHCDKNCINIEPLGTRTIPVEQYETPRINIEKPTHPKLRDQKGRKR